MVLQQSTADTPADCGGQPSQSTESRDARPSSVAQHNKGSGLIAAGSSIEPDIPPKAEWEDDTALIARAPDSRRSRARPSPSSSRRNFCSVSVSDEPGPQDDDHVLMKQPETRPISQEQLVAEVKGIYAGLVMVESKCIEIDTVQTTTPSWDLNFTNVLHKLFQSYYPERFFLSTSTILDRIYHRISQLREWAESELLIWLHMTEFILDRLYKRFFDCHCQILIYLLVFYRFFAEFPSGIRHLCTTMPWTIWPALVVLWGVCWMFIQHNTGVEENSSPLLDQQWQEQQVHAGLDFSAFLELNDTLNDNLSYDFEDSDLMPGPKFGDLGVSPVPTQNVFSTPSAATFVDPASFATTSFYPASLAANPQVGLLDRLANQDVELTTQQLAPASAASQTPRITHRAPQPNKAIIQSVHEVTLGKITSLAKSTAFTCPDCKEQFDRRDIFRRHMLEQQHGEFAGSTGPEYRCPNPGCRKSVEGSGFRRQDKLHEHLRKKSCKPVRRLSKTRQRPSSEGLPLPLCTPLSRPLDISHEGADTRTSNRVAPDEAAVKSHDEASVTSSSETSSPEPTSAVPISPRIGPPLQLLEKASTSHVQQGASSMGNAVARKPTFSERIAFLKSCCEVDEEELNVADREIQAMEEALRAKQQDRRLINERFTGSRTALEMLMRQQQSHSTNF